MVQAELESRKSLTYGRVSRREVLQGSSIMWIGESAVSLEISCDTLFPIY